MTDLLLDTFLRVAVILLVALVATRLMARAAAATRHHVWTVAVCGALAVPLLSMVVPRWPVLPIVPRTDARSAEALRHRQDYVTRSSSAMPSSNTSHAATGGDGSMSSSGLDDQSAPSPASFRAPVAQRFSAAMLLGAWALVALALLARIGAGIVAIRGLARRSRPAAPRWRELLDEGLATAGVEHQVRLLISSEIPMPITWGGRHAVVILPVAAASWDDDRSRVVLLHELAHVRRADWLTHALGRVLVALHWFNPLAWMAAHAMTRERERACDDYVLTHGAPAGEYAQHLLDIARAEGTGLAYAAAPAMARRSELEGRLLSILTTRSRERGRLAGRAITLAAAALTAIVAAASPSAAPAPQAQAREQAQTPAEPARPRSNTAPSSGFSQKDDDRANAAVKALVGALADPSRDVRESAAIGLAMTNDREALQPLIAALKDPDAEVREKAAIALGFRSESTVIDPLLAALGDESAQVREKAAIGLGFRKHPGVVDALMAAAKDEDAQVREKVILALGLSGDPRAIGTILAATKDPDAQVREKAVQAIGMVNSRDIDDLREAIRKGIAGTLDLAGVTPSIKR